MAAVGKKSTASFRKFIALCLIFPVMLVACAPVDALNWLVPNGGYTVERGIKFGRNYKHKLDIYKPDVQDAKKSVIVFFYGGAWKSGRREDYRFAGQGLASLGYTVVIPDYRIYPAIKYPDFLADNALAVTWVHAHIAEFGGDPNRIFVMGHSAGAYNAAMLALDERWMSDAGGSKEWIRGLIGLAGPYDFLPIQDPSVKQVFSDALDLTTTQPINFVNKHEPPALLLTGNEDEQVEARNTQNLANKLIDMGNDVTTISYPDVDHKDIIVALTRALTPDAPVLEDVKTFVDKH